jgi:DNA-3-methyladenine glycosylase
VGREGALPRSFFQRPVLEVARDCIGQLLVHRTPEGLTSGIIVEAEAYRGPEDRAAHSYGGRRTSRTEVMFGPAGYAYVFRVYGLHWHFNVVTGMPGEPHAVLLRAVEPVEGARLMARRRGLSLPEQLASGPGKLCQAFAITGAAYGVDLCESAELFLASPAGAGSRRVARSPRVGVEYAGAWARRLFRFYDPESPHVSRRPSRGARAAARAGGKPGAQTRRPSPASTSPE